MATYTKLVITFFLLFCMTQSLVNWDKSKPTIIIVTRTISWQYLLFVGLTQNKYGSVMTVIIKCSPGEACIKWIWIAVTEVSAVFIIKLQLPAFGNNLVVCCVLNPWSRYRHMRYFCFINVSWYGTQANVIEVMMNTSLDNVVRYYSLVMSDYGLLLALCSANCWNNVSSVQLSPEDESFRYAYYDT